MIDSFPTLRMQRESQEPNGDRSNYPQVHDLVAPHVHSFDSIFLDERGEEDQGLLDVSLQNLDVREVKDPAGNRIRFWIEQVNATHPLLSDKEHRSLERGLLPRECRQRAISYSGRLSVKLMWTLNDGPLRQEVKSLGSIPIMVRSVKCNLYDLPPADVVQRGEDPEELGGYFIVNGIERIVRLLIVARRNHPLAIVRPSFAKRGPNYTHYGIQLRCTREDQSSQTIYMHYCADGTVMFRFSWKKNEYLIPLMLILRSLQYTDDQTIWEGVLQDPSDTFVSGRLEAMLRDFKRYAMHTREECLKFLGSKFQVVLNHLPSDTATVDIGSELLRKVVLVHLSSDADKFHLLLLCVRKLYDIVAGRIQPDNPDSLVNQEVLLPGHLYNNFLKEKLDDWLASLQLVINNDVRKKEIAMNFSDGDGSYFKKSLGRLPSDLGRKLEHFVATGNLLSNTGMDLQQVSGFTIVAERLNFLRYIAHFRSIHRGAFFAELKTTTVRKLLPEAWGFLCPVHTPDGAPCGLLNHLAHRCVLPCYDMDPERLTEIRQRLFEFGISPTAVTCQKGFLPVLMNGCILGTLEEHRLGMVADELRDFKLERRLDFEVAAVPPSPGGLFPGLFLFTSACRFSRQVLRCQDSRPVNVGALEQIFLEIAVNEAECGGYAFRELSQVNMLSVIANLTPFCDFNQSPRNMYQCQMGKQSMGTAVQSYVHRTDNKLYRLYTPQHPIVRTKLHSHYQFDDYPNGMNAVVAVLAYTGYDMEDAMILNKGSFERGFAHACVYKCEYVNVSERDRRGEPASHHFGLATSSSSSSSKKALVTIDSDGLPCVGALLRPDDPLFVLMDEATGLQSIERHKAFEEAYVDSVMVLSDDVGEGSLSKCQIKYRIPRNPVIGDKFSSRHGQKGVCSQKWPSIDLPWADSTGIQPDIIINPHAFPSRMTIGMLVEMMAGKAGALHGLFQDATPFEFGDADGINAGDYFGQQLKAAGFNHLGNETLYSGVTGEPLVADIFMGVVYYQRLRHMVSDKFQVRTTGPVHALTRQPLKGRKRAGGIRLGEMERDSLLAHGASFLLHDRLLNCSDYSQCAVCSTCRSILSPVAQVVLNGEPKLYVCRTCQSSRDIKITAIPFVLRYLACELLAMNIDIKLHF